MEKNLEEAQIRLLQLRDNVSGWRAALISAYEDKAIGEYDTISYKIIIDDLNSIMSNLGFDTEYNYNWKDGMLLSYRSVLASLVAEFGRESWWRMYDIFKDFRVVNTVFNDFGTEAPATTEFRYLNVGSGSIFEYYSKQYRYICTYGGNETTLKYRISNSIEAKLTIHMPTEIGEITEYMLCYLLLSGKIQTSKFNIKFTGVNDE